MYAGAPPAGTAGKSGEQGLKKSGRPQLIGVCEGGAGHGLNSERLEAAKPGLESGNAVPEAHPTGELHKEQMHALIPTAEAAGGPTSAVSLFQAGKMMSRH